MRACSTRVRYAVLVVVGGILLALGAVACAQDPGKGDDLLARAGALLDDDPAAALALADAAVAEALESTDPAREVSVRIGRGGLYRRLGRYAEAVLDYERAVALANGLPDLGQRAAAHSHLGVALVLSSLYPEALEAMRQSLQIALEAGDFARASAVLGNLGNLLSEQGDYEGARAHYLRALAMKREHGIDAGIGGLLNNLGDLEREAGRPERAEPLLREAIAANAQEGNVHGQALARGNLGWVLAMLGRFDEALAELDDAERLAAGGEVRLRAAALAARGEAWLGRAAAAATEARRQADLSEAAAAIEAARAIAAGMDDPRRRGRLAARLADVRAGQGRLQEALQLHRESDEERREHERRADRQRQAVLTARYRSAEQAREIAELRARAADRAAAAQRQRGLVLLSAGGALALAAATLLLAWRNRERRRHAGELVAQNRALVAALAQADDLRRRSERLAAFNRQLLGLAGDDLRGPILQVRSTAERLLVDAHALGTDDRRLAAIVDGAGAAMRVADQIAELAALVDKPDSEPAVCDLAEQLQHTVAQFDAGYLGREPRLRLQAPPGLRVAVPEVRLRRMLTELVQLLLDRNPGEFLLGIDARREHDRAEVRFEDPEGALLAQIEAGQAGVALTWLNAMLAEAGGSLTVERPARRPARLLLRLPTADHDPAAPGST